MGAEKQISMDYREATYTDRLAIATLHAESWRSTYRGSYQDAFLDGPAFGGRKRVWQRRVAHPPANQFVVVAEEQADIVGFACAYGQDDPRWGTLLDNLHVRPALQRQGIGT